MMLSFVVEGLSEELFVWRVLVPHLQSLGLTVGPVIVVGQATSKKRAQRGEVGGKVGGGRFKHWQRDLKRLLNMAADKPARVTTLFDLYGLPDDFPGVEGAKLISEGYAKCDHLEEALKQSINDWRLIPYLQLHEFEALVLAALSELRVQLDAEDQLIGLQALEASLVGMNPEEVNDSRATAPSKRLLKNIPGYSKTLHGPAALELAGLHVLRRACPRFDNWLTTLEALTLAHNDNSQP